MKEPKPLIKSVYDKRLEVHYNEWFIKGKDNKWVRLDLQGKIKCPVLNESISSLACAKIMDKEGWPRNVDESCCKKCNCFVHLSIKKFQEKTKVRPNESESK